MQVIEKARERIAEIKAELADLERFVAVYDRLNENAEKKESGGAGENAESRREKPHAKPAQVVRVAIQTLQRNGRPMTRTELVKSLEDQGLSIGGKDKSKNMGTMLWRSKKFENIEGRGYWPIGFDAPVDEMFL